MKRAMKRFVKRAAALGLTAMMMGAVTVPAFATVPGGLFPKESEGTPGNPTNAEPKITKRVRVPEGVTIPGNTYTFEFTPQDVEDKAGESSPAINNGTSITTDDNVISITFPANSAPGLTPDDDGYMYLDLDSENILANTNFSHAGIYVYTVSERAGSTTVDGGTMTYSGAQYKMRVYVDNTENGNARYVKYVTFHALKDDTGTAITEETDETKIKPVFTNTYAKSTSFLINKTVAGTYADKTLEFSYTITLWNAPGATAASYDAEYTFINEDGTTGTRTETITANPTGATTTTSDSFTLKHGEQLKFVNIPVGTKYTLTEEASANYTASVNVSDGNAVIGTVTGTKAVAVIIGDASTQSDVEKLKSPIVLTDRTDPVADHDNKAEWTNTYADPPTPTGIIMNNFPFVVLIVIALAGFTGYIAMKRRSRRHQ